MNCETSQRNQNCTINETEEEENTFPKNAESEWKVESTYWLFASVFSLPLETRGYGSMRFQKTFDISEPHNSLCCIRGVCLRFVLSLHEQHTTNRKFTSSQGPNFTKRAPLIGVWLDCSLPWQYSQKCLLPEILERRNWLWKTNLSWMS